MLKYKLYSNPSTDENMYFVNVVMRVCRIIMEEDGTPHVLGVRPGNPNKEDAIETLGFGDEYIEVFNRSLQLAGRDIFLPAGDSRLLASNKRHV